MRFDYGIDRRKQQGTGAGGSPVSASFNTSFTDISQGVFGQDVSSTELETTDMTTTEQLSVDEEGIMSFINEILSGNQGLAAIFSEEAGSGLFSSSVAGQSTESLLASIAGELARVTGVTTTTEAGTVGTVSRREEEGLAGNIGDIIGGSPAESLLGGISVGGLSSSF